MIKFLKSCNVLHNKQKYCCEFCGYDPWWESETFDIGDTVDEDLVDLSDGLILGEDYEIVEE